MERKVLMGNDVKLENIEEQISLSGKKLEELIGLIKNFKSSNSDVESTEADILEQISKRVEAISAQNADEYTESLLKEIRKNFDEKQKFLKSKLNNIEEISQKLFDYVSQISGDEKNSLKKIEYVQNSVALFSADMEALRSTFDIIEERMLEFVNDNTKEKAVSKLIEKLKKDFETFNRGFELLISNMNEKFKNLTEVVKTLGNNNEIIEIKKEVNSIGMSMNAVISAISMIDFKYKDIQESLATLTKAEDAQQARIKIAQILEKSVLVNNVLETVAKKDDIKGIEGNIGAVNTLVLDVKTVLDKLQSDNVKLSQENLALIAGKLDELKVSLSEKSTNSSEFDDKFKEFYQKIDGLAQSLQQLIAMDSAQLLQKDMEVLSQKLETILLALKNTADKNTAAQIKDTANNLSNSLYELKSSLDNNFVDKIDNLVESFVAFDKKADGMVSILSDDKTILEVNKKVATLNETLENVKYSLEKLSILDEIGDIRYAVENLVDETDWDQFKEDLNLVLNKISIENDTFRGEVFDLKNNVEDINDTLSQGLFKKDFDAFGEDFSAFKEDVMNNYDRCLELFNRLNDQNTEKLNENFTALKADIKEDILQHKVDVINKIVEHDGSESFEQVLNTISDNKGNFETKIDEVKSHVSGSKEEILAKIEENKGNFDKKLSEIKNLLSSETEETSDNVVDNIKQLLIDSVNDLKLDYKNNLSEILANIKNNDFAENNNDIENALKNIETSLKEEFLGANDRFLELIQKLTSETNNKLDDLTSARVDIQDEIDSNDEIEIHPTDENNVIEIIQEFKELQTEFHNEYKDSLDDLSLNLESVVSVEDLQVIIEIVQAKHNEFQDQLVNFEDKVLGEITRLNAIVASDSDDAVKEALYSLKTEVSRSKEEILNALISELRLNEDKLKEDIFNLVGSIQAKSVDIDELGEFKQETAAIRATLTSYKDALLTLTQINVAEDVKNLLEYSNQQFILQIVQLFENISFVEEAEEIKDFVEQSENKIKEEIAELKNALVDLGAVHAEPKNSDLDLALEIEKVDIKVINLLEAAEHSDAKSTCILESVENTENKLDALDDINTNISIILEEFENTDAKLDSIDDINTNISIILEEIEKSESKLEKISDKISDVGVLFGGINRTDAKLGNIDESTSKILDYVEKTESKLTPVDEINSNVHHILSSIGRSENKLDSLQDLNSTIHQVSESVERCETKLASIDDFNSHVENFIDGIERTDAKLDSIDELNTNVSNILEGVERTESKLGTIDELNTNVSNILENVERTESKLGTIDELNTNVSNILEGVERTESKLNTIDELNSNVSSLVEELSKTDSNDESINQISSNIISVLDEIKILKGLSAEDEEIGHVYKMTDVESDFARMRLVLDELSRNFIEGTEIKDKISEDISSINSKMDTILESNSDAELGHLLDLKNDFQTIMNQFTSISENVTDISNRTNKLIITSDDSNSTLKENLLEFKEVIDKLDKTADTTSIREGISNVSESLNNSFKLLDKKLYQLRSEIGKASNISVSNLNSTEIIKDAFMHMAEWIDGAGGMLQEICSNVGEIKAVNFEDINAKLQVAQEMKQDVDNILSTLSGFDAKFNELNQKNGSLDSLQDDLKAVKADADKKTKELNKKIENLSEKFDEQNDRIESIESKLDKILELQKKKTDETEIRPILEFIASQATAANENSRENKRLAQRLEFLEHQINTFDTNITKIVSFIDEG